MPKAKNKEKILAASTDYRHDGWFAIVSYAGSDEEIFSKLCSNEVTAYEEAITEIQRIKRIAEAP
jgi:hypothetical protein